MTKTLEYEIGGKQLSMEVGRFAGQADAAVMVSYGETVVLVTVCFNKEPREGVDFLPLTIDYEERLYAAGKIPGGFIRREGRPSEEAILACRLTDRPLRPLLPKEWRKDIQIITTVLSADKENDPDMLSVIGSSAALHLSQIPFKGPVGAVHVGYINDEMVLNPSMADLEESLIDLVVTSTKDKVIMLEASAREVSEEIIKRAIKFGHEANQEIIRLQEELREELGKPKQEMAAEGNAKVEVPVDSAEFREKLAQALGYADKARREQAFDDLSRELVEQLGDGYPEGVVMAAFNAAVKAELRSAVLDKSQRLGGRNLTEVRPISCEAGLLPRTHGSAMFTRGQTQVLSITTLGSTRKEQMLDGLGIEESKRFMHHYNFPPFSTGEVKRSGSPSRREIGHGALAERALAPVLPKDEDFPYAIRLVSEVLSSSGSTSMASVCAGSLSLMDAGVPVKASVAGVAMGLVTDPAGRFAVLTDIEGMEDAYGDMDFKVAGTEEGITAIQMDTKIDGLTLEIVEKTLAQAREGRLFIMDKMRQTISASRSEVSRYAPRMHKIMIDTDKIGNVIGSGGKTIRSIINETKTTIDVNDDGTVVIGSPDAEAANRAIEIIQNLTKEAEVGDVYTGKVSRILDFGAMVEVLPGKEGLVHISELANYRVGKVEDEVKVGDEVTVKVIGIDNLGRVNLSRRAMFEKNREEGAGASTTADDASKQGRDYPQQRRHPSEGRPRYPRGDSRYSRDRHPPRDSYKSR